MNKTERAYMAHLEAEGRVGTVLWYRFEGMTLKLGEDCRFTPDFVVMRPDGFIELHDVKGAKKNKVNGVIEPWIEEDARVKLRTCAEMFPFTVKAVWPTGDGWGERVF